MIKYLLPGIILLTLISHVRADGWFPTDPDVVFYMDLAETDGTDARELSRTGERGTLNGGPARAIYKVTQAVKFGTSTAVGLLPHYINFTRTVGEDITCFLDAKLDFSGKPFMTAITFALDSFTVGSRSVWNYALGDVSIAGWDYRVDSAGTLNFGFVGVTDFTWNYVINDLRPHAYATWYDGSGVICLFVDGRLDKRIVTASTIVSTPSQIAIARRVAAGHAEFGGSVSRLRIKKNVTSEQQARSLAMQYFIEGRGTGGAQ